MSKITIIAKPTHRCNLNCPYCYDYAKRQKYQKEKDMNIETVEKTLKLFGKNKIREWTWHGGEPLIMGVEWLEQATKIIKEFDPNIHVDIQTNGTLIDEKFIEYFKKYGITVGLSFDGLNNDNTRKNTKRLFDVFELLKKENIPFGCINVITSGNINNLIEEYKYSKELGINIQMNIVFEAKGNDKSENIDGAIVAENVIKLFEYWIYDKDNPVDSLLIKHYLNMLFNTGHSSCCEIDCVGKWFGIGNDGSIYPCGRDWSEEGYFGTVYDYNDYKEILNNPNFINYRKQTLNLLTKCSKCDFYYACHGGCYSSAYNYNKSFESPHKEDCISNKLILTYMFNRLKNIDIHNNTSKYNHLFVNYLLSNGFRNINDIKQII